MRVVWLWLSYELKKKRKITLSFTSPEKDFFIFMKSLLHRKKENGPLFTTGLRTQDRSAAQHESDGPGMLSELNLGRP
jgi:hypothetical protein